MILALDWIPTDGGGWARLIAVLAGAYGLGCVNPAYYMARWKAGVDIRETGSGNAGATNAGRLLGRFGFLTVFLLDLAKGSVAVAVARFTGLAPEWEVAAGWTVMAGHVWPVQLRFRGGKGIATSLGAMLAEDPTAVLVLVAALGPALWIFRRFVLSGLLAFAAVPLVLVWLEPGRLGAVASGGTACIVWWTHRRDARQLWRE